MVEKEEGSRGVSIDFFLSVNEIFEQNRVKKVLLRNLHQISTIVCESLEL